MSLCVWVCRTSCRGRRGTSSRQVPFSELRKEGGREPWQRQGILNMCVCVCVNAGSLSAFYILACLLCWIAVLRECACSGPPPPPPPPSFTGATPTWTTADKLTPARS